MKPTAHWIAIDWGTSNLRVWKIGPDGTPLDHASSGAGMGGLSRDGFEPALLALIEPWLEPDALTTAMACGMVGSRQGWVEAPYSAVPCAAMHAERFVRAPVMDPRLSVYVVPGLKQDNPADVMRGEETQIAGFLTREPKFDGVLCLPGTHTKWAHISAEEVVSFATYMTGEMFALLSGASVLRHSVQSGDWSQEDFVQAVEDSMARPERAASRLFGLRADSLLTGLTPDRARARLSGLLIGLELAGSRPYWLGRQVVLIGAESLSATYRSALELCGLHAETRNATDMTLSGLSAAHSHLTAEGIPV